MRSKLFKGGWRYNDLLENFSDEQLKWLGAVAVTYNEAETWFYRLAEGVIYYPGDTHQILSRIGGTEGIPPIVRAAVERYEFPSETAKTIDLALAAFGELKIFRDLVLHARLIDRDTAYAVKPGRKGTRDYTTLEAGALKLLAQHLIALTAEFEALRQVLGSKTLLFYKRQADDQHRERLEAGIQAAIVQAQSYRNQRLSLPRLPVLEQVSQSDGDKSAPRRRDRRKKSKGGDTG